MLVGKTVVIRKRAHTSEPLVCRQRRPAGSGTVFSAALSVKRGSLPEGSFSSRAEWEFEAEWRRLIVQLTGRPRAPEQRA